MIDNIPSQILVVPLRPLSPLTAPAAIADFMNCGSTISMIPNSRRLGALFLMLAFVAITNHLVLTAFQITPKSTYLTLGLAMFYVFNVACIALFFGRSDDPSWLKYLMLIWIFALVDSQLVTAADNMKVELPLAALFAGQIGLLVTFLFMGTGHWIGRRGATGILGLVLVFVLGYVIDFLWLVLLFYFAAALAMILFLLRFLGFRLQKPESVSDSPNLRSAQFGLWHALSLTTVLALALGLLKGQEAALSRSGISFWQSSSVVCIALGIASAIAAELACWAALGGGRYWIRYVTLIVVTPLLGIAMSAWFTVVQERLASATGTRLTQSDWIVWRIIGLKWQWIMFLMLSGLMLLASLIFFRAQGLRFLRVSEKG